MTAEVDYQIPDFELRNLILKQLKAHKWVKVPGTRAACKCGWDLSSTVGRASNTNILRFNRHVAFEIEYAVTALLNEQEEAA